MDSDLFAAREFAQRVRFSGDKCGNTYVEESGQSSFYKDAFYCNELCLTEEVTPELFGGLVEVLDRLAIPSNAVEAFVYASPEINAQCYAADSAKCVIRFSSALIDILNNAEFQFVVGHELGHFLLSHSFLNENGDRSSAEFYIQQRAQEISADRMGLIACASIDVSIKALLKTISGLNDRHLKFNVGGFLSQLKKTSKAVGQSHQSTHPSILVRSRALLWFSMNEEYTCNSNNYPEGSLIKLDNKIADDLEKYVDGSVRKMIDESKNKLSMWISALSVINAGKFSKESQKQFQEVYGEDKLQSMLVFFSSVGANDLSDVVSVKVEEAKLELQELIPNSFKYELKLIKSESLR